MAVLTIIAVFAETVMAGVWPAWLSTPTIVTMVTATAGIRVSNLGEVAMLATTNAQHAPEIKTTVTVVVGPSRCTTQVVTSATASITNT